MRSRPYHLTLQRGVTSKGKCDALDPATPETLSSIKKSLMFGNNTNEPTPLQQKKKDLIAVSEKPTKVKSWYELTLEEDEDVQLVVESSQQVPPNIPILGTEDANGVEDEIPQYKEDDNQDSKNYLDPMEEDEVFENDEENFHFDTGLEED